MTMETIVRSLLCPLGSFLPELAVDAHTYVQNSEIFTLMYGSIVRQLITDLEDIAEVNKQLDTMCVSAHTRHWSMEKKRMCCIDSPC